MTNNVKNGQKSTVFRIDPIKPVFLSAGIPPHTALQNPHLTV